MLSFEDGDCISLPHEQFTVIDLIIQGISFDPR